MSQNPFLHSSVIATQMVTLEKEIGILLKDLACEMYRRDVQVELSSHRDISLTSEGISF